MSEDITIELTDEELSRLEAMAAERGLSAEEFAREIILAAAAAIREPSASSSR